MPTATTRATARDKLLDGARKLMLAKGYPATTVDDICAEAGVSKGSFYHFFGSKEELGIAVLESFARQAARVLRGPYLEVSDPIERARGYLRHVDAVAEGLWRDGCLLGNFAVDLAETHPEIRDRVAGQFERLRSLAADLFRAVAQRARERRPQTAPSAEDLADHHIALIEGSILLARASGDWSHVARGLESFRRYVETLIA